MLDSKLSDVVNRKKSFFQIQLFDLVFIVMKRFKCVMKKIFCLRKSILNIF